MPALKCAGLMAIETAARRSNPPRCFLLFIQAARTVPRNFSTSFFNRSLSIASDCAAFNTWPDAELVSLDPRLTSVTSEATCVESSADFCTLRAIS